MPQAPQAARSIHLGYEAPPASCFYAEMTIERTTPGSFFMACGFSGGYFGLQELAGGKRIALFSIWDPWTGDDKEAVPEDKRVRTVSQGSGVQVGRFGSEGTGGQCRYGFPWKLDQSNHFLIHAKIVGTRTEYAGYLLVERAWKHLVTFSTAVAARLTGLYSFVEDFRRDGKSVQEIRRAAFGNQWAQDAEGRWHELLAARFTASDSPLEAASMIDAGVIAGKFYLQNGGGTRRTTDLQAVLRRPANGSLPTDLPIK